MKDSLKVFVKDYIELCKQSNQWMKKHWKGYLVFVAVMGLGSYVYVRWQTKKVNDRFINELHRNLDELTIKLNEES